MRYYLHKNNTKDISAYRYSITSSHFYTLILTCNLRTSAYTHQRVWTHIQRLYFAITCDFNRIDLEDGLRHSLLDLNFLYDVVFALLHLDLLLTGRFASGLLLATTADC